MQARIPGAKLEILAGVGHFSAIEAPGAFADHILAFLEGIGPRKPCRKVFPDA
jgi:pimeloyl-ACP methyl ester carboxylesterase